VEALSFRGGRVVVDARCKGCGRCVNVCPTGALTLRMDDGVDVLGHLMTRIERRTTIG
jgi:Fe-S-cluster-containing hydrogenase component 2